MWTTVSVYIALVLIAVVLYYLTRNTTKTGGKQNFWDWIKRGTLRSGTAAPATRRLPAGSDADELDAVMVLEDIYREFQEESARLRQEMEAQFRELDNRSRVQFQALHDEMTDLRIALQYYETDAQFEEERVQRQHGQANRVLEQRKTEQGPAESRETIYFRILDELQQGKQPEEISLALGVGLEEVRRVIHFMSTP